MSVTAASDALYAGVRPRLLAIRDARRALRLSDEAMWNQTVEDWRFLIDSGEAVGLDSGNNRIVGTAAILPFEALPGEPGIGWISMLLVTRVFRRKKLGGWMLDWAADTLRARGLTPVLDATPAGRKVYARRGFIAGQGLLRLRGMGGARANVPPTIIGLEKRHMPEVVLHDAAILGGLREHVLRYLLAAGPGLALAIPGRDGLDGFLFARPGRIAVQLGPISAANSEIAFTLVDGALARLPNVPVLIDAFDEQYAFCSALRRRGFLEERPFTRMYSGDLPNMRRHQQFAAAGPELG